MWYNPLWKRASHIFPFSFIPKFRDGVEGQSQLVFHPNRSIIYDSTFTVRMHVTRTWAKWPIGCTGENRDRGTYFEVGGLGICGKLQRNFVSRPTLAVLLLYHAYVSLLQIKCLSFLKTFKNSFQIKLSRKTTQMTDLGDTTFYIEVSLATSKR